MPSKLVVITVNYCCAEAILDGLDETVAQLRQLGDCAFWIVDNQSPDGSEAVLRQAVQDRDLGDVVSVIAAGSNGGFGAGNNVAIQQALSAAEPPQFFYFLNPDAIPKPGAIASLVDFMTAHPDAGIAGGLLCNERGEIEASLFRFPSFWSEIETAIEFGPVRKLLRRHIVPLETPAEPIKVDWVSGASFIARADAIKAVGGFDETFFLYFEEVELCHRVTKSGYAIYATPEAVIMHSGGVSTGIQQPQRRMPRYWFASRNYFFHRTGCGGPLIILNLAFACGLGLRRVHETLRGRHWRQPHFLRDFIAHLRAMPDQPPKKF